MLSTLVAFALTLLLLGLRLIGVIEWPWYAIAAPSTITMLVDVGVVLLYGWLERKHGGTDG